MLFHLLALLDDLRLQVAEQLQHLRWAFDISIIIVDLMYFSAFDVVLTVFQCVLGHSTRST